MILKFSALLIVSGIFFHHLPRANAEEDTAMLTSEEKPLLAFFRGNLGIDDFIGKMSDNSKSVLGKVKSKAGKLADKGKSKAEDHASKAKKKIESKLD